MAFCPNCGAPAEGRYCQKCGAPLQPTSAPPVEPRIGPSTSGALDENIVATLCYLPFVDVLFLVIEPYSRNRTIRFHAFQSIFYYVAWMIIAVALRITGAMLFYAGFGLLWVMLTNLVELALFIGLVIMAVKAFQRQRFVMPIVGPLAAKQAGV